jgi:hypothetical protein
MRALGFWEERTSHVFVKAVFKCKRGREGSDPPHDFRKCHLRILRSKEKK